ncbi:MAG: hypothetical protein H6Q43_2404 [Deltaproteobacteria bacterium]|nr:hypothetical protein [Deltaproteobacteria bacterium]
MLLLLKGIILYLRVSAEICVLLYLSGFGAAAQGLLVHRQ